MSNTRKLINIVTAVILVLMAAVSAFSPKNKVKEPTGDMVDWACKDKVREVLKSPSTADFVSSDVRKSSEREYTYQVTGVLDAQNSFGAKIRSNYTCVIKYNGTGSPVDSSNWTALSVNVK